jgi:hypothetical protein
VASSKRRVSPLPSILNRTLAMGTTMLQHHRSQQLIVQKVLGTVWLLTGLRLCHWTALFAGM